VLGLVLVLVGLEREAGPEHCVEFFAMVLLYHACPPPALSTLALRM